MIQSNKDDVFCYWSFFISIHFLSYFMMYLLFYYILFTLYFILVILVFSKSYLQYSYPSFWSLLWITAAYFARYIMTSNFISES